MFRYAFAFPQNSPYRDTINTAILSLQETGATVDLWNKWAQSGEWGGRFDFLKDRSLVETILSE